jgi:hypothetical protein
MLKDMTIFRLKKIVTPECHPLGSPIGFSVEVLANRFAICPHLS